MSEDIAPKILFTVHSHFSAPFFLYDHNSKFLAESEDDYAPDCLTAHGDVEVEQAQEEGEQEGMTPAPDLVPPTCLQVTMDEIHMPRNDQTGFVFGSNSSTCDILLDDSPGGGISNMHFSISINPKSHSLILKNISRNQTKLRSKSLGKTSVTQHRALQQNESVYIRFSAFEIEIRVPDHGNHWARYVENLVGFYGKMASSIPDLKNLDVDSTSTSTASGTSLYSLNQRVGSGACGEVYRAVHIMSGQVFAAKQLTKTKHARLEEVMLLREMEHDNIVKFVSFVVEARQHPILVMEFVDGPDLKVAFKSHHPEPLEVRLVLRQLLNAVQYVHARRIVHRDIKPSNIMVWSRDPIHVKLTDFGLAAKVDKHGLCYGQCGSPGYAAPEVILGKPYGKSADMWSLGVVALQYSYGLPRVPVNLNPSESLWHLYKEWPSRIQQRLGRKRLTSTDSTADFISMLLILDRASRSSAEQSLTHSFFSPADPVSTVGKASSARRGPKHDSSPNQTVIVAAAFRAGGQATDSLEDTVTYATAFRARGQAADSPEDTVTYATAFRARGQTSDLPDTEVFPILPSKAPLSTQASVLSDRQTAKRKRESSHEVNSCLGKLDARDSVIPGSGQELVREAESASTRTLRPPASGTSAPGKRTTGATSKASQEEDLSHPVEWAVSESRNATLARSEAPTRESISR